MSERLEKVAIRLHDTECSARCDPMVMTKYHRQAAALAPLLDEFRAEDEARALREAADDPALRLSGHSGVSIKGLRLRAALAATRTYLGEDQ